MSWNIETEVEQTPDGFVLHCASMSVVWKSRMKKSPTDVRTLAAALAKDIPSELGLPKDVDTSTAASVELYLNQCGCTAESVRHEAFHSFMDMPVAVKEGLKVAQRVKAFSKAKYVGLVSVHPRFVRRVPTKLFVAVCVDVRGGWLLLKKQEKDEFPVMTFKITASVLVELLPVLNNSFVLKFNQRQWVLQLTDQTEFDLCCNAVNRILKSLSKAPLPVGDVKEQMMVEEEKEMAKQEEQKKLVCEYDGLEYTPERAASLAEENDELQNELAQMKDEALNMQQMIEDLKKEFTLLQSGDEDAAKQIELEMTIKKAEWMSGYKQEIKNLKDHIKELKPLLKADSAVAPGGGTTEATTDDNGGDEEKKDNGEPLNQKDFEDYVGINIESAMIEQLTEKDPVKAGQVRFKHMHIHKHKYIHIHEHKHVHLDQDTMADMDDIKDKMKHKHVVRYTTTHTQTQYLVPKRWFRFGFGSGGTGGGFGGFFS